MADSTNITDPKLSILTSVKRLLGIAEDYEHFDTEIILNINSVLTVLNQLGLGPKDGFGIEDKTAAWDSFIGERKDLQAIITYVSLKVRLMFDPPQSGFLVESINKLCQEFEWRLNVQAETPESGEG